MNDGHYAEPAKPFARWSRDTELAFLQALRLTGQVRKAASEIGRSTAGAYGRRKRYPEFAAAWDAAVAQQQADWIAAQQARLEARGSALDIVGGEAANGGGRLTPARGRFDGWDQQKRGFFLRTLRKTKSVKLACEAARMSDTSAYRLKSKSPAFAAAWERALADAPLPSVLEAAVTRAIEGWDEPIVQGGKIVAYRKRYSDALMRDLLRAERGEDEQWNPARDKRGWNARNRHRYASKEETDAALEKKLDVLEAQVRAREERAAREAHREDWEDWKACWTGGGPARRFEAEDEGEA